MDVTMTHSVSVQPEMIDWSVCLLTLKHLVSLQARVRPSVQADLDLYTSQSAEICENPPGICISVTRVGVCVGEVQLFNNKQGRKKIESEELSRMVPSDRE